LQTETAYIPIGGGGCIREEFAMRLSLAVLMVAAFVLGGTARAEPAAPPPTEKVYINVSGLG